MIFDSQDMQKAYWGTVSLQGPITPSNLSVAFGIIAIYRELRVKK
jgi:hypothetical protein